MKTFISFLIFCLIATCNTEIRTWTAVNGKEVEAEFVSNEKGIVKLKLYKGNITIVSRQTNSGAYFFCVRGTKAVFF